MNKLPSKLQNEYTYLHSTVISALIESVSSIYIYNHTKIHLYMYNKPRQIEAGARENTWRLYTMSFSLLFIYSDMRYMFFKKHLKSWIQNSWKGDSHYQKQVSDTFLESNISGSPDEASGTFWLQGNGILSFLTEEEEFGSFSEGEMDADLYGQEENISELKSGLWSIPIASVEPH